MEKHFKSIWDVIKIEVLSAQNNELTELTLITIKSLIKNLSQDNHTSNNAMKLILEETMPGIKDINSNLFEPSFNIVCSCLNINDKIALLVAPKVLPILICHYRTAFCASKKAKVVESIKSVCDTLEKHNIMSQLNQLDRDLLQNEIMYIFAHEKDQNIFKTVLQTMKHVTKLINKENRLTIYSKLVDLAANSNYSEIIVDISNTISSFDSQFQEEVPQFVLDPLKLLATSNSNPQPMKLLVNLMFVDNFNEDISRFIFQNIFGVGHNAHFESLRYLVEVLTKRKGIFICTKKCYIEEIISFIQANPNQTSEFLIHCKNLLEILVNKSDVDVQKRIIFNFVTQLEPEKKNDLYMLSGILGHMNPNIHLNGQFERLSQKLIQISISTKEKECQVLCNHLLCSLFNKVPDDNLHKLIMKSTLESLRTEVKCHKVQAVEVFSWISKALLIRGYDDYDTVIDTVSSFILFSV